MSYCASELVLKQILMGILPLRRRPFKSIASTKAIPQTRLIRFSNSDLKLSLSLLTRRKTRDLKESVDTLLSQ